MPRPPCARAVGLNLIAAAVSILAAVAVAQVTPQAMPLPTVPGLQSELQRNPLSAALLNEQRLAYLTRPPISLLIEFDMTMGLSRIVAGNATGRMTFAECDLNETQRASNPSQIYPQARSLTMFAANGLDVVGTGLNRQLLIGSGMPGAHLHWFGRAPPYGPDAELQVARIVGQHCHFDQTNETTFIRSLPIAVGSLTDLHMPPITSVKLRESTGDIFIAFRHSVVVLNATTRQLEHYYGQTTALPTNGPAPYDNTTTVIPVTKPPMPNVTTRLDAVTENIGRLAILGDRYLVVLDGLNSAVRLVEFDTGIVSIAASSPDGGQIWPPAYPCLRTPEGCDAFNVTMFSPHATATAGSNLIFVASTTFPTIYLVDIATNTVRFVAGVLPDDIVNAAPVPNVFRSIYDITLAPGSDRLVVASSRGVFTINATLAMNGAKRDAPPAPPPQLCDITRSCSGHASTVVGVVATGCVCECKRGWTGAACEVKPDNLTATRTVSRSTSATVTKPLPLPIPKPPKPQVEVAAETTVIVTTSVSGVVGTPTVATQAGRAKVLLELKVCEVELDEEMGFAESPTGLALGSGELRFAAGAVVANIGGIVLLIALQYGVVLLVQYRKQVSPLQAQAYVRFPSLGSFPVLFAMEGTAYASTLLIHYGAADLTHRIIGVLGLLACIAFVAVLGVFYKFFFQAKYETFDQAGEGAAGAGDGGDLRNDSVALEITRGTLYERLQSLTRWLLNVKGKWREPQTFQTKRFGGMFMDYRPGMQSFAVIELGMALITGALSALKPLYCRFLIITIGVFYVALFVAIVYFSPADNRYTRIMMVVISGLQALSAVLIVASDIAQSQELADRSIDVLYASMFVVGVMSLIDAVTRMYLIVKYVLKKVSKRRTAAVANSTFLGEGDQPLLPVQRPLSPGSGGPGNSSLAGGLLEHPVLAAADRQHSGNGSEQDPFTNFSFSVRPPSAGGAGATTVTPDDVPPPRVVVDRSSTDSGGQASGAAAAAAGAPTIQLTPSTGTGSGGSGGSRRQNQALEELRAELDDLLTGRTAHTGRLDDLLEAAARESSGRGSGSGGMGSRSNTTGSGSNSHSGSNNSLTHLTVERMRRVASGQSFASPTGEVPPGAVFGSNRSLTGMLDPSMSSRANSETLSGNVTANGSLVRRRMPASASTNDVTL